MKKILRVLASRYFLAALCILLEFAQLLGVFVLLRNHFWPVNLLGWALQLAVLIYIINRDEIPEFKLPWILVLLLIPVTGAFIFLLFASNDASKKQRHRHDAASAELRPYIDAVEQPEALRALSPQAARQAEYIRAVAGAPCRSGTRTEYYPLGDDFWPALLEALEGAKRFILLEYFIIQEGRVWSSILDILKRKAAQGVEVYVMYDDFGCMKYLSSKYYETLQAAGIHAIPANRLRPVFTKSHNNRDHRKITVVDGLVGFTGGVNLSDRYMNLETIFGHWKDSAIRLEGPAVRTLTALFLTSWNTQTDDTIDVEPFLSIEPPPQDVPGFTAPFGDGPPPLYTDRIGKNVFLSIILAAVKYVYITTPYLICDYEILNALRLAAKRGVDVRIITPHIPDKKAIFLMTRSNYLPLVQDGVKIYEYTPGFIHAKNFLADDEYAVCGSINLDYRSLVHNFECAVWMYGTESIHAMRQDFLDTIDKSQRITPENAVLPLVERLPAEILKVLSTLM